MGDSGSSRGERIKTWREKKTAQAERGKRMADYQPSKTLKN